MRKRHKWLLALTGAACATLLLTVALAVGGGLGPKPDTVAARGGVGQDPGGKASAIETATPVPEHGTPEPTATLLLEHETPEPTATPLLVHETPEPSAVPGAEAEAAGEVVYYSAQGNYYHAVADCSGMVGAEAHTEREAWAALKSPCPVCLGGERQAALPHTVYYTQSGRYYHGMDDCGGMHTAAAHDLAEAAAAGKARCPACLPGGEPGHYALFTQAFGQELEALYAGYGYAYTRRDASGGSAWVLERRDATSDGAGPIAAVSVVEGAEEGDPDSVSLTLNVEGCEALEAFMDAAPDPVRSMYAVSCARVSAQSTGEAAEPHQASCQRMKLTFDGQGALRGFELALIADHQQYFPSWALDGDRFRLVALDTMVGNTRVSMPLVVEATDD